MSQSLKKILIGSPIPISKLPSGSPRYPWLEILGAIQPGTAQQVKLSYAAAHKTISKLAETGSIPNGEYTVTTRTDPQAKGGRIVYIVRMGEQPKPRTEGS